MWLLVGLGNPGERYRTTRHNLGWHAMERVIQQWGLSSGQNRFAGRYGDGTIGHERVLWLMPETYMNLSGRSVAEAARFYKIPPEQILVFHDDLDLAPGRVRIKTGGGNGGHNGLKSMQEMMGTANFVRVRLGIGRPTAGGDPASYVLSPFTATEREVLDPLLDALAKEMPAILAADIANVLNRLSIFAVRKESP
ncbi:MAG: aminoacyl-tRNA hydrolase [Magnetococcales bacterium]|nr:aminoacyl-tRNA hydrolase [Magnetococcales bacterium]NGZ25546.1 aminoacyl-tRNA hydrolase [Magnetococcales bacterium]